MKTNETYIEDVDLDNESKGGGGLGYVMTTYHSYTAQHSAEIEKKLLRRIDIRIMPLVVTIYIFSYLDRNSVSSLRCYSMSRNVDAMTDHSSSTLWPTEGYKCQRCCVQYGNFHFLRWLCRHATPFYGIDDEAASFNIPSKTC
jgi:hypothetical protein